MANPKLTPAKLLKALGMGVYKYKVIPVAFGSEITSAMWANLDLNHLTRANQAKLSAACQANKDEGLEVMFLFSFMNLQ